MLASRLGSFAQQRSTDAARSQGKNLAERTQRYARCHRSDTSHDSTDLTLSLLGQLRPHLRQLWLDLFPKEFTNLPLANALFLFGDFVQDSPHSQSIAHKRISLLAPYF